MDKKITKANKNDFMNYCQVEGPKLLGLTEAVLATFNNCIPEIASSFFDFKKFGCAIDLKKVSTILDTCNITITSFLNFISNSNIDYPPNVIEQIIIQLQKDQVTLMQNSDTYSDEEKRAMINDTIKNLENLLKEKGVRDKKNVIFDSCIKYIGFIIIAMVSKNSVCDVLKVKNTDFTRIAIEESKTQRTQIRTNGIVELFKKKN